MSTQPIHHATLEYPKELRDLFPDHTDTFTLKYRTNPAKSVCLYYSSERNLDSRELLIFLKNKLISLDAELKEWFLFSSYIQNKPVLIALLWMKKGWWKNNHIMTHELIFENIRPFFHSLANTYGHWRDALIQKLPLTNLDLRGIFQRPVLDSKYGYSIIKLSILKILLRNFRVDLRSLDYTFSFEQDETKLKLIKEIMAARLLADNRWGQGRGQSSLPNLQKHSASLLQITKWKFKWNALNKREKYVTDLERRAEADRTAFKAAEDQRQRQLKRLDTYIANLQKNAADLRKRNAQLAKNKEEDQKENKGWFSNWW